MGKQREFIGRERPDKKKKKGAKIAVGKKDEASQQLRCTPYSVLRRLGRKP